MRLCEICEIVRDFVRGEVKVRRGEERRVCIKGE